MKSKTANQIDVVKRVNLGHFPVFVQLAHKGLEKAQAEGKREGSITTFTVPKDLLSISVSDPTLVEPIESLEFHYSVKAGETLEEQW